MNARRFLYGVLLGLHFTGSPVNAMPSDLLFGHGADADPQTVMHLSVSPVDALPDSQAVVLGEPEDLQVRAISPVAAARSAGFFQLGLSDWSNERTGLNYQVDAGHPDALTTVAEVRLQFDPTLSWRLTANQQDVATGDQPFASVSNRFTWQPLNDLAVSTVLEVSGNGEQTQHLESQVQWRVAPFNLGYEWREDRRGNDFSRNEKLSARLEEILLGKSARFDLFGRAERSGDQTGQMGQSNVLGGNFRLDFGTTALKFYYESRAGEGITDRDGFASAQISFVPMNGASFRFTYDSRQQSGGLFSQGIATDLQMQLDQSVQLLAGFEWREGLNSSINRYAPTNEKLNLGVKLSQIEVKYTRSFALPGQPGDDGLSVQFNGRF